MRERGGGGMQGTLPMCAFPAYPFGDPIGPSAPEAPVASVLFEPWEADALRALLSLWCGAAVPELDADPDDDKLDVPDEPAGPDVVLGEEDPTAGLVEEPDELDDAPDPEPVAGAGYLTGVTPLPDPDCPVGGRFVCFCRCAVCVGRRFEVRCCGPLNGGAIAGVAAMAA